MPPSLWQLLKELQHHSYHKSLLLPREPDEARPWWDGSSDEDNLDQAGPAPRSPSPSEEGMDPLFLDCFKGFTKTFDKILGVAPPPISRTCIGCTFLKDPPEGGFTAPLECVICATAFSVDGPHPTPLVPPRCRARPRGLPDGPPVEPPAPLPPVWTDRSLLPG